MLYVVAHTGEEFPTLPTYEEETLLLTADSLEIDQQPQAETIFVYVARRDPIEGIDAFQVLDKNIRDICFKSVTTKVHELESQIAKLQEKFENVDTTIDGVILELKGTRIDSNLLKAIKKSKKMKTLFDCFGKSESEFKELALQTKQLLVHHQESLKLVEQEHKSLKEHYFKVTSASNLDELLSIRNKLKHMYSSLTTQQLVQSLKQLLINVDIFYAAKNLASHYKECLEEVVRRRNFHEDLNQKIADFNKILAMCRESEQQKRVEFYARAIGESSKSHEILISVLFPILSHTQLPAFTVDPALASDDSSVQNWTKEMHAEAEHLPQVKQEDVLEASWINLGETMVVPQQQKPSVKISPQVESLDNEEDVDSDDESDSSLCPVSPTEIIDCLNHKDEQLQRQAKEIEDLKKSLSAYTNSIDSMSSSNTERQLRLTEEENRRLLRQIEELREELVLLTNSSAIKTNTLESLAKQKDDLIEKLKSLAESKIEAESQIGALTAAIADAQKLNENIKTDLLEKEKQNKKLAAEIADLKVEIDTLKQVTPQIEKLHTELQAAEQKVRTLEEEKAEVQQYIKSLKSELKEQKELVQSLTDKLAKAAARASAEMEQRERIQKEGEDLAQACMAQKKAKENLEREKAELLKLMQAAQTDAESLHEKLSQEKEHAAKEKQALIQETMILLEEKEALKKKNETLQLAIKAQQEEFNKQSATSSSHQQEKKKLEEQIAILTKKQKELAEKQEKELHKLLQECTLQQEQKDKELRKMIDQISLSNQAKVLAEKQAKDAVQSAQEAKKQLELMNAEIAQLRKVMRDKEAEYTRIIQQKETESKNMQETLHKHFTEEIEKFKFDLQTERQKLISEYSIRPNEIKVAVCDFQVDDIVFFKRKPNTEVWEIFNQQAPNYFLAPDGVNLLKQRTADKYALLEFAKMKILYIDTYKATKNNPYGLAQGTEYHIVHIYP